MIHGDVLGERARMSPDKLALVCVSTGLRLTYRELDARASRCARVWRDVCGLSEGDRVAILSANRVEFVEAFFAAAKAQITLVPLNTRLTPRELEIIWKDSGARGLMYGADTVETVRQLARRLTIEHLIALDDAACEPGSASYADLCARAARTTADPIVSASTLSERLQCLLYTSGTTGKPKGVMIPQRMIGWNALNTVASWQLRPDDVSPIFTPLYHAGGLTVFLTPIFAVGGTIVLHTRFDVAEIWQTIEREGCTVALGVPTIFKMLIEAPEVRKGRLRWFISGGAPLPVQLIQAFREKGIVLRQGYGLTEVGVNCFALADADAWRKPGTIGKPMMFTEARVVGPNGMAVPIGEVGELCLRGPHVSAGYWNDPPATRAAFEADGCFHTGDLARVDEEGFYYIAGRIKDMFISGGVNVYPAEIEAELSLHPDVCDAAVLGVPDPTWGEVGVAFVVLRDRAREPDLTAFLSESLAKYKVPKEIVFVDSMPRTPYGKVVKGELRERYRQRMNGAGPDPSHRAD
ncbi:MAG: long-chain fatty acid--CoA ligase [Acidobacteria bacterium]|nr:long-chain fatty acid--CoA ligase [Acidobacteriota bacterium]